MTNDEILLMADHTISTPVCLRVTNNDELLMFARAIEQAEKREWIGLTDEEVRSVYKNVIPDVTVSEAVLSRSIARAIEAKLKEKNHAS